MKKLTCRGMGGACDAEITGSTEDEMMGNGMKHMEEAHPEMAADIKKMDRSDPMMVAWGEKFKADYSAAPEM